MRFDAGHITAFRDLSCDDNPLHCDPLYARKTQFGEPILFGVAAILAALGRVFAGRQISLHHLKAAFLRPILLDREYRVEATPTDVAGGYRITISQAAHVHVRISLSLGADRMAGSAVGRAPADWPPPGAADAEPSRMRYAMNWRSYDGFCRCFALPADLLSAGQLTALVWSSYYVGTINPGTQALFTTLELALDGSADAATTIEVRDIRCEVDDRYHMVQLTGTGTGISRFAISALRRPLPVRHSMEDVRNALAADPAVLATARARLGGKRVFVAGGSRGLGSVFARGLADLGAVVVAACRHRSDDADAVEADLTAANPASRVVVADLADPPALRRAIEGAAADIAFDMLVCSASPVIKAATVGEMGAREVVEFVARSLTLFLTPLETLLPRLTPGSRVVVISSAFATQPEAQFGHYVAAKRAIEGLSAVVAREHPTIELIILRPPRFLSDQTNTPIAAGSLPSAVDIFRTFLARLLEPARPGEANLRFL
jgi:NAD(P)-dependent dehydrogenase (short-subunit alcohol dehydrogenase family)/acyl dehydratase